MSLTRRDFLAAALLAPAAFARQTANARFIGVIPFVAPGTPPPPFGRLLGAGLDARLFTDLSTLGAAPRTPHDAPRTPVGEFFVRTAVPRSLPALDSWRVRVAGLVATPIDLPLRDLEPLAIQGGRYLMECSGNS